MTETGSLQSLLSGIRRRFRTKRCVVYTCLFGHSELFNDFAYDDGSGDIEFICFTDDPHLKSRFWKTVLVGPTLLDPARAAKRFKALPHRFLPQFDVSLYLDNTIRLKVPPAQLFDRLASSGPPLLCFHHQVRDCVYQEAEAILQLAFDDAARVRQQMAHYRYLGYPPHNGLAASGFLLRRHHDPQLCEVMEQWHQQVLCHSKRDQLSLLPVAWFNKFEIGYLPYNFLDYEIMEWPVLPDGRRLPRDFDDARYMTLNPDVTINPRRHYLMHGEAEGRRYK